MKVQTNVFDIVKSIVLIAIVVFVMYQSNVWLRWANTPQPTVSKSEIEMIAKNIVKETVVENAKAFDALVKELKVSNEQLMEAVKKDKGKITEVAKIVGTMEEQVKDLHTTNTWGTPEKPEAIYDEVWLYREEGEYSLPIGRVFYTNDLVGEEEPWTVDLFPIDYNAVIVETEGDTHKRYVELWAENNMIPESKGKKYPIAIKSVQWEIDPIKTKSFSFNPRLSVAGVFGTEGIFPALSCSFFSYGKTKVDNTLRFLEIGVGGDDQNVYGMLSPISYNIGENIPLISNLFIGPVVTLNWDRKIGYGLSVAVPF